jgi:hypothetical protein
VEQILAVLLQQGLLRMHHQRVALPFLDTEASHSRSNVPGQIRLEEELVQNYYLAPDHTAMDTFPEAPFLEAPFPEARLFLEAARLEKLAWVRRQTEVVAVVLVD